VNCQRQGEACDYSIRLNWDGRGKKKTEVGDGSDINFSSGMITFGASQPSSRDSTTTPTTPNIPIPPLSYTSQPSMINAEEYGRLPPDIAYSVALQESASQYAQQPSSATKADGYGQLPPNVPYTVALGESSPQYPQPQMDTMNTDERYVRLRPDAAYAAALMESESQYAQEPSSAMNIDPALIRHGPQAMYEVGDYGTTLGRPDHQYTQSYERYRSLTPGTPISAPLPPVARFRQTQSQDESLSPTDSAIGSPNASTFSGRNPILPNIDSPKLTPPFYGNGKDDNETAEMPPYDRPLKRVRYQAGQEANASYDTRMPPPNTTSLTSYNIESQSSSMVLAAPASSVGTPLTPASSLSDDGYTKPYPAKTSPHGVQESPDLRRLSVSSLLSGPPGMAYHNERNSGPRSNPEVQDWSVQYQDVYQDTTTWGIDRGIKDLDIGKNDDMNAITGASPIAMRDHLDLVLDEDGELMPIEFGFGMGTNNTAFENVGYYDKPVAICIPRVLEPLPSKLLENPMNLLVSSVPLLAILHMLIRILVLCEPSNCVI
jgi:hypothetical protein